MLKRRLNNLVKSFIFFTVINLFAFNNPSYASPTHYIQDDFGYWTPVYFNIPITNKIKGQFEVNPRIEQNGTHINQLLIRPSLGYQLTKHLSVWQGYAWVTNYIPSFVSEQRIWQQILYERASERFPRFSFVNRFRVEERFVDHDTLPVRLRDMLRFQYALGKTRTWSLVLFDEPFVNVSSLNHGPQAGVDQNRLFVGLNKKFSSHFNMDFGYLMQYINIPNSGVDKMNHNILVNFYITSPQILGKK